MSQTLAKHRKLEIVESFNGYYLYLETDGRPECRGMGDGPIYPKDAEAMLHSATAYSELMKSYFPDFKED